MQRRIHVSWFIGWSCLAFVLAVAWAGFIGEIRPQESLLLLAGVVVLFCLRWNYVLLMPLCIVATVYLGFARAHLDLRAHDQFEPYINTVVMVRGTVAQDPATGAGGIQKVYLDDVSIEGARVKGSIWISLYSKDIKRGDYVHVKGKLAGGFGSVSATMYRATLIDVIRPYPGDIARRVRDWFGEATRRVIPEPEVNLGLGYLVGQKTALPLDLEEDIRIVGLTHAVVASGYNLTILVVFCRNLFMRVSKFTATATSMAMVFGFMCVTGFSPSMTRAGMVATLGLLTWYYGRKAHPFVLLSFVAATTVAVSPGYVWGDLGWYLSFSAFFGVIVLAPLLHRYFWGTSEPSTARSLFVETVSAQIVTQPLIQYSFGLFSAYALPANLAVLPLVPMAMLTTFIAGVASLLIGDYATIFALPATAILHYSVGAIKWWAGQPNSQFEYIFNIELMLVSYIVLGATILFLKRRTNYDFHKS
jgi:competence protein ComEC